MILKKTVKTGLAATGVLSALFAAGCTSVVQTPVDQLMSEQIVVPSAKPGTQIAGIPSADDIQAMAQMETEVANARAKAMEEKRIAAAAAAAAAREQAALCAAGAANATAPAAGAPTAKAASAAAPAVNCPAKAGDPVTAAAEKSGPTVELAEAVNTPATSVNSSLAYAAPPLPASSDAFAAQTQAMQGSGLVMADAPASMTIAMAPGGNSDRINLLITKYASIYGVPETLVHRVAKRESTYNPRAQHRGNYGLMQIRYNTAKSLGYDGAPTGLLDAETNLKYAVKYLRGAWIVAGKNEKAADWLYRTGYYYDAKRKGLLDDIQ
ncbi:lytic transglycosylase domain-containing protein [Rhizobium sp. C4]|uniref:lytic transglycosylase domain-containing protein n=1 Tax=Rhizobium sp. C4 TaxID=1349800 RepID=UPI001E470732|nr:lytic transglycosylase domain-containing protein [Rhizobium sp. C4]MCD2173088.1 lytic transglycosylase domain-containing protein [Rhizobium sp. C4]